ncbi:MAG: outer membrane lipoprotein chaperone LolA [Ignavibacteriales bacterium]|nr:outer membrane lipoprotein chaperone LolA [Ignavibacteriales bacterium]
MKTKIFILICFISSLVFPQSANEFIKKIQNKFKSINNFTADFSQNYFDAQGHDQGKTSGKFSYKRKNRFIVDLNNQFIVSDGQTVWNNDKRFNRVVISKLSDDPTSFSLERFIFDYPPLCKSKIIKEENSQKGEGCIELTPKDQDMEFKYVKIWISSDGMISRLEVLDRGDMRYAFQFTDLKINQDLPDARFTYYPPKGIKIIDLR